MTFALQPSVSFDLTTAALTTLVNFTQAQSVQDIFIVNRGGTKRWVSLWFDYDGTLSGTPENFLTEYGIAEHGILHITGLWVFQNGGRISAQAEAANQFTVHISRADV